ncbi:hypothetical protein [Amycolatopsis sp. NPDC051716]|uniref:hypothetical protein n=1 Tax=Actinomycetes TaxID=1760 RepID=UPI003418E900
MSRRRFLIRDFVDFLTGGDVATVHTGPIPIWAGFIIEQNARILEILEKFMPNIEAQLKADIASLVDSNTKIVALSAAQVQQIGDLQGQVAALKSQIDAGGTITAEDVAALDDITAKIAATAASTADTAGASATSPAAGQSVEPQQPITSQPVETAPATDAAAPVDVPVQQPITSDGSDAAKVSGADDTATDTTATAPAEDSATEQTSEPTATADEGDSSATGTTGFGL